MDRTVKIKIGFSCICFLLFVWVMTAVMGTKPVQGEIRLESEPVVAKADEGKKIMYLTFDDGPSRNTREVLDILKQYDAKATFFVTGAFDEYESLIKEEAKAGHTIGLHTNSHEYETIYQSQEAYFKDLEEIQRIVQKQTGQKSKVIRFPGGVSNTVSANYCSGIMSALAQEVGKRGYEYYDWNASNGDGNTGLNADALVETMKREVGDQDVVMLLMHDGAGNGETVKALPAILSYLTEQGYEFRAIDDTTPQFHHHINN